MRIQPCSWTVFAYAVVLGGAAAAPATAAQQWSLATADTQMTIGVDDLGRPAIYELKNPSQSYNWTSQPSPISLIGSVQSGSQTVPVNWQFQSAAVDTSNGAKLTLQFTSAAPGLQYTAEWWARPGAGPIHQASYITNTGGSSVTIPYQSSLGLQLTTPQNGKPLSMWSFSSDGGTPDAQGVYKQQVAQNFSKTLRTTPNGGMIPLTVLDSGGSQGLYAGAEWSYGDIQVSGPTLSSPQRATLQAGNVQNFSASLTPGQVFTVPPSFIGTYSGNIDSAGNSLRKYLYNYSMPSVLRNDTSYPKVQWNAFGATGKSPGSWDSVQSKYYPFINSIAPLGFEEVMLDVGWWQGSEPVADPTDWPTMSAASAYAHNRGIRFGLYWTDGADMTTATGRTTRAARITSLYQNYQADLWRSDATSGPVIAENYWSVKGFYEMVDRLQAQNPNFQWENCSGGGRIKDYGAMQRSVKIFNSDTYSELDVRKAFYDSSYAFLPMQLEGHLGSVDGLWRPQGAANMKYAFRTMSMGAPEWFIDAPNGGNGTDPWTAEEKAAIASCVATYKDKLRPLIRNADLFHVFPRPDGTVWDGIEYFDPETDQGAVYIFKPNSPENTHTIVLQGLDADQWYRLTFEDGSNPSAVLLGSELMSAGIPVTLYGTHVSELMFIEVPEPCTLAMLSLAGLFGVGILWRRRKP
jgi:hypothetical protein